MPWMTRPEDDLAAERALTARQHQRLVERDPQDG